MKTMFFFTPWAVQRKETEIAFAASVQMIVCTSLLPLAGHSGQPAESRSRRFSHHAFFNAALSVQISHFTEGAVGRFEITGYVIIGMHIHRIETRGRQIALIEH